MSRSGQDPNARAPTMESGLDHQWLVGEPGWWKLPTDSSQHGNRRGETSPPETWSSTNAQEGGRGWTRQRLQPVAPSILLPLAWSPLFLLLSAIPLVLPERLPTDDQIVSALFFSLSWALVLVPLYMARSTQPMSGGTILSLPFDWATFAAASATFALHVLTSPLFGWASYALFWVAWFRTYRRIKRVLQIPSSRWLLPIDHSKWGSESMLPPEWQVTSESWTTGPIAALDCDCGRLAISGASRGDDRFLAIALIDRSGFVHDPFHIGPVGDALAAGPLSKPPVIDMGLEWPERLLALDAQKQDSAKTAGI